jgi:hypothetical protein
MTHSVISESLTTSMYSFVMSHSVTGDGALQRHQLLLLLLLLPLQPR